RPVLPKSPILHLILRDMGRAPPGERRGPGDAAESNHLKGAAVDCGTDGGAATESFNGGLRKLAGQFVVTNELNTAGLDNRTYGCSFEFHRLFASDADYGRAGEPTGTDFLLAAGDGGGSDGYATGGDILFAGAEERGGDVYPARTDKFFAGAVDFGIEGESEGIGVASLLRLENQGAA